MGLRVRRRGAPVITYPAIHPAYRFARDLDLLHKAGPDNMESDALLRVGELLDGLSIHGFEADLAAALDRETERAEEPGCLVGLSALTWIAKNWLESAKLIMFPAIDYLRPDPPPEHVSGRRAAA